VTEAGRERQARRAGRKRKRKRKRNDGRGGVGGKADPQGMRALWTECLPPL